MKILHQQIFPVTSVGDEPKVRQRSLRWSSFILCFTQKITWMKKLQY